MILYEDNHIIVANKPAGINTQPDPKKSAESLEDILKKYIKKKYKKSGNVFLHAVHRIDREVSGAVIFAKTSKALSRLNSLMRKQKIIKIYHAFVEGIIGKVNNEATLKHYIKHDRLKARVSDMSKKDFKEALLQYKVLKTCKYYSLIEISLTTGRYHQIRAQLAFLGFPIVGDKKYGAKTNFTHNGIALHSRYIEFVHPVTKEIVKIIADYPNKHEQLWQ